MGGRWKGGRGSVRGDTGERGKGSRGKEAI